MVTFRGFEVIFSQCGVGKWRKIKCLFLLASHNQSIVYLKDKWRNLLRASYKSTNDEEKGEWDSGCALPRYQTSVNCY